MAGSQISTSVTIINSLLGFQAVSLTEFDTSAESSIAAGSKVEIASAFFTFAADEAISGFSAITTGETAYIALTPSGTAGSQIVSAAWTEDAPVWDDAKQGWYSTTSSSVRYVGGAYKAGTSSCENKWTYSRQSDVLPEHGGIYRGLKLTRTAEATGNEATIIAAIDTAYGATVPRGVNFACSGMFYKGGTTTLWYVTNSFIISTTEAITFSYIATQTTTGGPLIPNRGTVVPFAASDNVLDNWVF